MRDFKRKRKKIINEERKRLNGDEEYYEKIAMDIIGENPEIISIYEGLEKKKRSYDKRKNDFTNKTIFIDSREDILNGLTKDVIEKISLLFSEQRKLIEQFEGKEEISEQEWFKEAKKKDKKSKKMVDIALRFIDKKEDKKRLVDYVKTMDDENENEKKRKKEWIMKTVRNAYLAYKTERFEIKEKLSELEEYNKEFTSSFYTLFKSKIRDKKKHSYFSDLGDSSKKRKTKKELEMVDKEFQKGNTTSERRDLVNQIEKYNLTGEMINREPSRYFEENPEPKISVIKKRNNFKYKDNKGNLFYSFIENCPVQYSEIEELKKKKLLDNLYVSTEFDVNRTSISEFQNPYSKKDNRFFLIFTDKESEEEYTEGTRLELISVKHGKRKEKTAIIEQFHKPQKRKIAIITLNFI